MKRSPLAHKTPLRSHTGLQSHSSLKRSPIKHHRSKRARSKEFSPAIRVIVMERSDGMCELCHMRPIAHIHHTIFRSQGGTGELENALGVCIPCHDGCHKYRVVRVKAERLSRELAKAV